jgi:hypothetical protein
MARRRPIINRPEYTLPATIATSFSPAMQPVGDTYQDLVDDGSIGTGADQVAAGDHTHAEFTSLAVRQKSLTILEPTGSEDISIWFTQPAITITHVAAVLVGSSTPSVTWTLRHGTDRSGAGSELVTGGTTTTTVTTPDEVTSFDDATVIADSHVWLETTAQSGTVDSINLTITYTE